MGCLKIVLSKKLFPNILKIVGNSNNVWAKNCIFANHFEKRFHSHKLHAMNEDLKKKLSRDSNGLLTYEYIDNNIDNVDEIMPELVQNMINVDSTGQFVASTARYLHAIDAEKYADSIDTLVKAAIDKDRERCYLPDLIAALWGADYKEHAEELSASDDNFRRIYKRLYPAMGI